MHANAALIEHFYAAFARRDAAAMAACYAPDAHFRDPIFDVKGAGSRRHVDDVCERGRDLALEWRDVQAPTTRQGRRTGSRATRSR